MSIVRHDTPSGDKIYVHKTNYEWVSKVVGAVMYVLGWESHYRTITPNGRHKLPTYATWYRKR